MSRCWPLAVALTPAGVVELDELPTGVRLGLARENGNSSFTASLDLSEGDAREVWRWLGWRLGELPEPAGDES